jgi:itaconate CoA-transferase
MAEYADAIAEALSVMTTVEAVDRMVAADVAAAAVVPVDQVRSHPQVVWNDSLFERADPQAGRVRGPRHAPRFADFEAQPGDVPALGQHTTEVLVGLGLTESEVDGLRQRGVVGGPSD